MRIRDWQDIVADVTERNIPADDWRAVAGDRVEGVGEDLYLAHPAAGVFFLKTYAKNPYEVQGVGSRVARSLDDEIGSFLPEEGTGRFAVRSAPEDEEEASEQANRVAEVVRTHAEAPTTPGDMFDDVMEAMESPAFGPMEYDQYDRPDELGELSERFEEADRLLSSELDDLIEDAEVGRGFQ